MLGVLGGDEVRVGRELVAAAAGVLQRRVLERGEAVAQVLAHDRLRGRLVDQLVVGIERRALDVVRGLDAVVVDVGGAVHRAVVVDPAGRAGPRRPAVDEQQLLARDGERRERREQRAQPAAAGPDHHVALQPRAVLEQGGRAVRPRTAADDVRAVRRGLAGERAHRVGGPHDAGLGLEQDEREVVAAEARVQVGGGIDAQALERDALRFERLRGGRLPAVVAVREPGDPALVHQARARLALELAPERPRAAGHRGVVGVGAVRGADQPRLAA